MWKHRLLLIPLLLGAVWLAWPLAAQAQVENPKNGSVGMQGKIASPPPTTGATISLPRPGQVFTEIPITVSGICPTGLLVKVFKNNVFAGSAECKGGSFSILIDLFNGQNELVVRVYDALDQPGPDSATTIVTFNDGSSQIGTGTRPTLTSNYAKRGANPGEQLVWPIVLSGGSGPYAVSVDWGDGTAQDLISLGFPGPFDIKHTYQSAGIYNIIVKATDRDGESAYLQLVGVANGKVTQADVNGTGDADGGSEGESTTMAIIWRSAAVMVPFSVASFWLGGRFRILSVRKRLERGDRPF